ncbi:DUF6398 domain-containing protein [Candidatus Magnetobacterium casense]|uniref:DUF6398 domain-containing protein n=1 Tax=Candidatus Magnetobacterium casense TaxID=1455061 RepID=UPI00058B625A|nr:DUF6398 domain-containing protein [Candidatus Magnetobacterium casensis]
MPRKSKSDKVPKEFQEIFNRLTELTDDICKKHLNEEYAMLARQVTASLCRKRPSPLISGNINSWACGILYALGHVNFLFDKASEPYMSAIDLCEAFGVPKSTGANKSKIVRDALNMTQLDPKWCLPSKMDDNPMAWMIMVNGFIVDARSLPRHIQEEACRKGIIPYMPADRNKSE